MRFLNKMERKYGLFAIENLTLYIILTYVMGFVLMTVAPNVLKFFSLEPYYILQGQFWRIISWVLLPPMGFSIWTVIMLFFYYSIGRQLEREWGDFRYNVYVFGGIFFTIISSFVLYFVMGSKEMAFVRLEEFSTYYICLSLFFGYAMTNPDHHVLLWFIIPIKMKWMALISLVYIVLDLFTGSVVTRTEIIASLVNFLIFFGLSRGFKTFIPKVRKRPMKRRATGRNRNALKHKCVVCGRTEKDGDNLEFRYCSKCEGDYEYCQDHLFSHKHVKMKKGE